MVQQERHIPPVEWNVRCGDQYLGTVHERPATGSGHNDDEYARCAALVRFGEKIGDRDFSVSRR